MHLLACFPLKLKPSSREHASVTGERDLAATQLDGVFRRSPAKKHEGPVLIHQDGPFVELILLQRRN
jgi:hypothetical protein